MPRPPRLEKQLLDPTRVRRLRDGFSWIDRRFVREGLIDRLDRDEILLYFFLVAVADARGLSYYSDRRVALTLQIPEPELLRARHRLVERGLLAYRAPLYQVLDLPEPAQETRRGGAVPIAKALRDILGEPPRGGA